MNESSTLTNEQFTVVTRKGQITVPAQIRKALGLHIGDRVAVSLDAEGELHANLRPVSSVADATFGSIHSQSPVTEDEVHQAFAEHVTARDQRSKRS